MTWIVLSLCTALLCWMLYMEWRRPNRRWLIARIIASILSIAGICCLATPLYYAVEPHANNTYTPAPLQPLPNSIQHIGWNPSIQLGQALQLQGSFLHASKQPVTIMLSAFGTNLDSVRVSDSGSFELRTVPKQVGRATLQLSVLQGTDTLESNPLAIEVSTASPQRLLLLSSAPDFEKRFLKNWLSGHDFSFAVRTLVSAGKWDQEFVNRPAVNLGSINTALLQQFDLLVADQSALAALTASELNAVNGAVAKSAIGLVVLVDSARRSNGFFSQPFPITALRDSLSHALKLTIEGTHASLNIESPAFINRTEQLQPDITDSKGRLLSATSLHGTGRITATTITNAFSWQLAGNGDTYSRYWSHLLSSVTPQNRAPRFKLSNALPRRDELLNIHFRSAAVPRSLQVGETMLYPTQDRMLPQLWHTSYWPRNTGWQPVLINDSANGWFYVYGREDWKGVKRLEEMTSAASRVSQRAAQARIRKQIPQWYFFVLFLLSAAFLWYEKKRHGI